MAKNRVIQDTIKDEIEVTLTSAEAKAERPESTVRPDTLPTEMTAAERTEVTDTIRDLLDGRWRDTRAQMRKHLADPRFKADHTKTIEQAREEILPKLELVSSYGMPKGSFSKAAGGTADAGATLTAFEMLGHGDLSIMVKSGVQWGLFGGAIDNLGTERHMKLAGQAMNLELLGCFGMTERGHGSDVQNLLTTMTYDPETEEFIVHSPSKAAEKTYIGNAARDARMAAVFAQLHTPGGAGDDTGVDKSRGVHCILVPIRDDEGNSLPGVTIGDHGHKGGLPGVDNGTLLFDQVRVPRENLLNRFGDVAVDGSYSSPIESQNRRFFTMLGTLVRGRISVGAAAGAATRSSLSIAVRYANRRRQFEGLPGQEKFLMQHRTHRLRLLVPLARSYALALAQNKVVEDIHDQNGEIAAGNWDLSNPTDEQAVQQRQLESNAAAVKVAGTAHATRTIQECREACGGAGYMEENLLTSFKENSDVFTTFEGDNTVLLQLVAKEHLTAFAREMGGLEPMELIRYGIENVGDVLRRRIGVMASVRNLVDGVSDRDVKDLFHPGYQLKLLEARQESLLKSLANRLRAARKAEPEEAVKIVDRAQDHMVALAWSSIDLLLLSSIIAAEKQLEDGLAKQVFEQVRQVFALSMVVEHGSWFQEQNMLGGNRIKAARASVNDLVDSLAPWSDVLVDAFGIPDELLDVPMLRDAGVSPAGEK